MNNDTNPTRSAGAKPSLLTRPTLTSPTDDAPGGWEDSRILSNSKMGPLTKSQPKKRASPAENRSKAKANSSGFGWKTVAAVGVLCVGSILAYQYVSELQHNARVAKANAEAATAAAALADANALALPPAPATPEPGEGAPLQLGGTEPAVSQAAQIVNEPLPSPTPAAPVASTQTSDAKLVTALENGVKPPPAALEKALQPSALTSPQAAAQPKEKPPSEKNAEALAAKKPVAAQPKLPALLAVAKAPVAPAVAPTVATEKDVSLLAALVAHNSAVAPKPAAPASTAVPDANSTTADATQRVPDESADALLKRCAALEPERQGTCRVRACAGTRASEPACKAVASSSPAPVAPAPVAAPAAPAAQAAPSVPTLPTLPALPAIPLLAPAQ